VSYRADAPITHASSTKRLQSAGCGLGTARSSVSSSSRSCSARCGSSGGKKSSSTPTTAPAAALSGTPGPGVTATEIKVGVMMIDYKCIEQFVDSVRPDQQKTYQIFIDDLNSKGGINGRQIKPVFKTFCPVNAATEIAGVHVAHRRRPRVRGDRHVSTTRTARPSNALRSGTRRRSCRARSRRRWRRRPPGMMVTPDISPERRLNVIMSLLKSQGTLNGEEGRHRLRRRRRTHRV